MGIERKYIRVSEIPATYDLSRHFIYRLRKAGKLTIYKIGGAALVRVDDLETLIEGAAS